MIIHHKGFKNASNNVEGKERLKKVNDGTLCKTMQGDSF